MVDANLEWSPDNERWTIGLWARNLFDNRYIAQVFDTPPVKGIVQYASPREYGVSFNYNW